MSISCSYCCRSCIWIFDSPHMPVTPCLCSGHVCVSRCVVAGVCTSGDHLLRVRHKHGVIAEGISLFKLARCQQSCRVTMIRALHLLLTVHPVDNYPIPLICLHEETHQDLLFSCRVDPEPCVRDQIVRMNFALIGQWLR